MALEHAGSDVTGATGLVETDEVAWALITASNNRHTAEAVARNAEWEREQSAALLRTIIETTPSLIYAKDLAGRIVLANGAFLEVLGKTHAEVVGQTDLAFRRNQTQAETVVATDRRVMATGQAETCEEDIGNEGNQPRVWLSTKTPLHDADREVVGLVAVSVEITERKRVEDRLRQMVNELNHRVKNTLATVQSIASHTLRGADRALGRTLEARLMALASAHDVLTREEWEGANLTDVIAGALTPYGGVEDSRFHVSGPTLRLLPRAAVALAMGLHELVTNALKFGSLSVGGGQVDIRWAIVQAAPPRLHMIWSERNGPPVTPPVERGFGTRLIERSLAQDLGGTAQITFAAEGIICVIDAPLDDVVATAKVMSFPQVGRS
jgi:PAS domain S-box-containing protein